MPRDGTATRTRIMDAAQRLILDRGYSGTALDEVLAQSRTTKGAFFHHFPSKLDLAHALVERYSRSDLEGLEELMARAESLASDPLQQLLVFVGLHREMFADLTDPPGCLMASFISEAGLLDRTTITVVEDNFRTWRRRLRDKLDEVAAVHPPVAEVDLDDLADAFLVVIEGAFVVSRTLDEVRVVAAQLDLYRTHVALLFGDRP